MTIWRPFVVQFYDHTGIAQRLEKLALEGWKLEATGGFGFWKFRRIEPMQLHYTITYFAEASEFDPEPGERQTAFMDLCAQSGWEYIDHSAQMLIFCSAETDPIPIETDAAMQVETIHKAVKKNFLPAQFVLLVLAVIQFTTQISQYRRDPVDWLSSNSSYMIVFCYLLIFLMCVVDIGTYYRWRKKALAAAQDGLFVKTKGQRGFHGFCLVAVTAVFVLWMVSLRGSSLMMASAIGSFAAIMGTVVVAYGIRWVMKKLKFGREVIRWVTYVLLFLGMSGGMIYVTTRLISMSDEGAFMDSEPVGTYEFVGETQYVYADPIPLTLEGLGYVIDYPNQSQVEEVTRSLLMTVYSGSDISPWGQSWSLDLYYTLYVPRLNSLMDTCSEGALEDRYGLYGDCRQVDASQWDAIAAYAYYYEDQPNGHYVVIWPDRILEISYPDEPTAAQIAVTVETLKDFTVK